MMDDDLIYTCGDECGCEDGECASFLFDDLAGPEDMEPWPRWSDH